jgi:autotransporter-associated beta strand protein
MAATGTWTVDAAGNWTGTPANWQGGVIPNAIGDLAIFRNDISAARTVTLNAPITLGGLSIGDLLGGSVFTFAGTSALTMDSLLGNPFINKYGSATDVISAPLTLTDNTDFNIFTGTLDVTGALTGAGNLIKNQAGALRLSSTNGFTGNFVLNFGTLNIGGANGATPATLGTGTGGIILNGTGRQDLAIFSLNNNGAATDGIVTYSGNNDVIVQGAATINVDRNFTAGANDRVNHSLDKLTLNGGILRVTSSNSHRLTFTGTTLLSGQTNVIEPLANLSPSIANLTLEGVIDDGAATNNLIKEGAGRLAITGTANTYGGITAVKNGILSLGAGANLGGGRTYVNGGVLSVDNTATLNALSAAGGLALVGQLGTSRYAVPVLGYTGTAAIDAANPVNVTVPLSGMVFGIDGATSTANIDLSQIGGTMNNRVWLGNVIGFDRFLTGNVLPSADGSIRLTSGANNLIISGAANRLGGAASTSKLVFGWDHANPLNFGAAAAPAHIQGGTVSVRVDNDTTGAVTINRAITVNANGAGLVKPLGTGVVTMLGGTLNTDATNDVKLGNTDFRLFGGSTLLLDNSAVTAANANRRLGTSTDIDLSSSTLRLIGDGGAATVSSQALNSLDYAGGSTISVDTDGAIASRLTTLTLGSLNRVGAGTLNLRNISNTATTFGTATGTQKLIVTSAPTVTNGMIGANIALWGGANANDGTIPLFASYDATHGVQAAAFGLTSTLTGATASSIVTFDNTAYAAAGASIQALRIRSTANTSTFNATSAMTIGSTAATGQGAGLFLIHTADNTVAHTAPFNFGSQEALLYTSTTGGSSIVNLTGVLNGSNGLTKFGDGVLQLSGTNTYTGSTNINAGELRLGNIAALGGTPTANAQANLYGGSLYLGSGNRFYSNVSVFDNARFGNVNVGSSAINNLSIEARSGSTAPVVLDVRSQAGANFTTAYGTLAMNANGQLAVTHPLQVNGGITGSGNIEKYFNERLVIAGDSSSYSGNITAYAGVLQSYTSSSTAKPFGSSNTVTINPGAHIVLTAPTNINASQVTVNSDLGGIATIGQMYVGDPAALPAMTINSTAPHFGVSLGIGAVGYSQNINQSTLFGGNAYLGAALGYSGIFTGTLTPAAAGYLLGGSQGTLRIASPLTGSSDAIIGISMTNTGSRADQVVNNSGLTLQYDVPMSYTGNTILNPGPLLRLSAKNALTNTGNLVLAGGQLRADSASGQNRMIAPISLSNTVVMTADSTIQMENTPYDFRIGGNIQLAPGSTGVVRTLAIGNDQPGAAANNAGMVYLDGGISDGTGGSGNHFFKNGVGTLFFTGTNTYTGSTTIQQGLIGINADSDWGATTGSIVAPGGGIAIWENSFTTGKNYSAHGGNFHFDVAGGLTLTQGSSSVIDGTSSIVKRGLGTLILNGENAVTGLFAGDGVLQFNNLLSTANSASTGSFSIGGDITLGGANNGTRYTGGTMRFNFTGTTSRGFVFNNNTNTNFAGGIDVTTANTLTTTGVISQGTELDYGFKTGPGTLVLNAANTWRGVSVNNGVLQFANSTPWANSTATAADNTNIDMMGGTIRALNTGANILLANNVSTTNYNYGGGTTLSLGSGTGFSVELNTDNLIRQNQGTLVIQTEGATTLGGVGNINTARLITTNLVNSGLARASALNNGIFPAHLLGANSTGAGFFLQDAATGFVPYSGATNTSLSGLSPAAIGAISSPQSLVGLNSIYALSTTANISGGTLAIGAIDNVKSGGILLNGSNTISSNLVFDPTSGVAPGTGIPGEALVFVKSGENAVISGNVTANAFTKFGAGSLTLSGNNAIMGDVSVQSGTLRFGGASILSRMNGELNLNAGATLDLNGNSVAVESVGSNNRTVATAAVGGTITNSSGTAATLAVVSPIASAFDGVLSGNLKLLKGGIGTMTINGFSASTPEAGVNTYTGGTDLFGYNTTGGINLNNTTTGLGGGAGGAPVVNLFSGQLGLLFSNGTTGVNGTQGMQFNNQVVRLGGDGAPLTLNVFGPALLNVNQATPSSNTAFGVGNIMTVGAMNLSNATLQVTGGNLYRARAEGAITILGSQAAIQTNADGPSGALELAGVISGSGALTKLGDGTLRGIVISNPGNTYSGGTNIVGGDVQVTATTGTPLGTGPVRILPDGTLRLAGNGSVNGANLTTMSRVNALGAVVLDDNFDPTVLNSTNFSSVYNTALQLGQPFATQALNMGAIGDGRAFLGTGVNGEVAYTAATLGAGVADSWNPGVGVYRIAPASSSFAFSGVDNVLTGGNYLQVGSQRNNVLGVITNGGGILALRNSNNYTEGTQITKGAAIYIETGGRASGESPLGSGAVEVYGELRARSSQGSFWNAFTSAPTNAINLRPGGIVRLHDGEGTNAFQFVGAGNQGRWGDSVGLDLNGGSFIYNGAPNLQSIEAIGAITARKAGQLQVLRNSTASAATLTVTDISRAERGVLGLAYNTGFLGINVTTPLSFERIVTGTIGGAAISRSGTTTNGSGVVNGGIVAPWIIDRTTNSFVGYDPTATSGTGFQPLISAAPGAGQIAYNQILTGATITGLGANDTVDVTTAAKTFSASQTAYALRTSQNINPTAGGLSLTLGSGGLIMTGGTINATGAVTSGVVSPMTLNFGAAGAGEAFIYNSGTAIIQAQINAAQGLTKFGAGQLQIHGINPGIGAPVVLHEGTTYVRVPYSGTGSPVGQVLNGQDIIVNGGTLNIQSIMANAAGTASEIANTPTAAQASLDSDIFIRGDAALRVNGAAQYVRIADLTIGNSAGSTAMNGNSSISLNLQSGLWVRGTTTLGQEAVINSSFDGFAQSTLAGKVTGSDLVKYGNGAITMLDGTNDYTGGTTIWGTTNNTAASVVASAFRGTGSPFGAGDIQIQPGGLLRIADNANIASNAVYLRSDGYGLGGIGVAHNGVLPNIITSGTPSAGQIKVESTGPFDGVIALDYGYYSRALTPATVGSGNWWIGNSQQNDSYYFNSTIGASANGKYLLGGGGSIGSIQFGSVLVSAGRTSLFENVFSGGTANQVRIEIGAQTGDFAWNSPSFVNGNSSYVALTTRNAGLVGDVRVNTNITLGIGNNFALGSGRLIVNGGFVRSDTGNNNFVSTNITLNNQLVLQGDLNTNAGVLTLLGDVAMSDVVGAGATRIWNMVGGDLTVRGVVSGAMGSNLIKRGQSFLTLSGANTYQGYTQIDRGTIVVAGNVLPGVAGPLGNSDSPIVLGVESTNNSGSLGIGGRFTIGRDLLVAAAAGTGVNLLESRTASPATMTGGISVATGTVLTVGAASADNATFRGGQLDLQGAISGAGAVVIGTTAAAPGNGGTVRLGGGINGYGANTYSGGTTLQTARIQLNGSSYYTGPADNPVMISGPLGTGAITFGAGEGNRGAMLEAFGGPVTIVNALNPITNANTLSMTFGGTNALTFTRNLDLSSDATLRNRTFVVQNLYQPVTFSGNFTNSGVQGSNFLKQGPGKLILTGTNTQANLLTTDANYGTGVFIDGGVLQVNSNAALGSTAALAAAGSHLVGPADVRLRGGYLAVTSSFSTDRQFILTNGSGGIDVASGQTLTLTTQTAGAFGLRKVGLGTLALQNSANTMTSLVIGGGQQLTPGVGFTSHRGGVVSTTATTGNPFVAAGSAVTIEGGALALVGGGTAQALTVATVNYGANAAIALSQGATSSQLTATALTRLGAFNSVNYGTLTVVPSTLANLGSTEKLLTSTASLNTTTGGGDILTTPSIFIRLQAPGSDANFARYDAVNGIMAHSVGTVTTLGTSAGTNVADISTADTAGAGNIDIQAIRTSANIAPTDSSTLLRVARGGLIINGNTASTLSANTLFGTGTGASLNEAIVYVREGQTGISAISGNITARDFTKTGPGNLEISGSSNLLNTNATRLPVLSVQDGTLRFATSGASFQNQLRGTTVGNALGHYALNVNDAGVFDLNGLNLSIGGLNGNGTITSGIAGSASLTVKNGLGVDTTFSGSINNGSGTVSLTKMQNGILTLNGHSTFTGGTTVQAGRVTNGTGAPAAAGGRLEAQTVTALGTGGVTLQGGALRLNAATLLNAAQNNSEVINGFEFLRWGGANGLDITVSASAFSNGTALPANTSTFINAATQSAGLNNLTVNAPIVSFAEGIIQFNGSTTLGLANTELRTAGGRLFFAGKVDADGGTIIKTGANDLVLTNGAAGAGQNDVGLWKVYGGMVEARTATGDSNPFGIGSTIEVNPGTTADARGLRLLTDGDGTNNPELVTTYANTNLRLGSMLSVNDSQFVSSGGTRVAADRVALIANNSFKTVQVNNLEVGGALGSAYAYFVLGNNNSIKVNGTTSFMRDLQLQVDGGQGLVLNGLISGNGTLNRRANGGTLYINADNSVSGGYQGGTFFTGGGRNYLGSILGNQVTLSDTAKLGKGHVWIGSLATFQINSAGNLQAGQNFHVSGSTSWAGTLSLAADLSLDTIRLRSNGLGGIQDGAADYFLSGRNPSSGVLALGTVYTQALDMSTLGDGMWFLGSMTNGIGANGAYDAATLRPGLANAYRLGAGGSTLFLGTNGNTNVLTDVNSQTPSSLVVGAPMTVQNAAPLNAASGVVVLMGNQNYTGATTVNRTSTLDFRGTLTTSGIENYGTVNVAGEAGTFINPLTGNNIPVTLRPGGTIRFDNTTAGVLPVTATQGRWKDSVGLALTDNVVRLQGNAAVEVTETVGGIDAVSGGNRLEVVRAVPGRVTELRTPSITRSGTGTLQFVNTGSQLGSDERVIVTGTAPTVTNGMVAPWMVSTNDIQFLTYNQDFGFTIAGFDRVQAAATLAATVSAPTERTLFSGAVVLNAGVDFETYALRLDGDVTLGTATDNTAQLILGSGGLISNGTRTIRSGIQAGAGASELVIYNNGTTAIGEFANPTTAGQIAASSITKFGGGVLQFLGNNAAFTGDIRVQQGTVELNYRNTADVATNVATTIGGNGGNIVLEGAGSILNLRGGTDGTGVNFTGGAVTFAKGIVLGDYVPTATISLDRSGGTAATSQNKTFIMTGGITFGANNGDVGQILKVDGRNGIRLQVDGTTTLNGRSSIAVENGYAGGTSDLLLNGKVTGSGTLVKGPSDSKGRNLELGQITAMNDYSGGTVLQGGTLRVIGRSNNIGAGLTSNLVGGGLGSGDVTLMQGILDFRVDGAATGAADTDIEFVRYSGGTGVGSNLIVKGSSAINADRNVYTGTWSRSATTVTATLPGGHGFTSGQTVNVTTGYAAASPVLTGVSGNTLTYTVTDSGATSGVFVVNNNSGSNKMLTFNNLSIGSEILTVTGGNGYGFAVGGTTTLLGNAFFNNSTEFVLGGVAAAGGAANSIATDGGQVLINKVNTGTLWVNSANNNLTGPTYINAGLLTFGNRAAGNTAATLGSGDIFVNPGAAIQVRGTANVNTGLGQQVVLTGTPYSPAVFRSLFALTQADYTSMIASGVSNSNQVAILAMEATTPAAANLDMSAIGDGRLYLGSISADRTYGGAAAGSALIPGLANLPNSVVGGSSTNRVYRLGGGDGTARTTIINLTAAGAGLNNVGGTTDVQIGSLATAGLTNYNTGFVYFQDQNTYTGQTVVSRGLTLRFNTAMATGNTAGPLGANASSLIDIYGGLRFEGTGNLFQNGSTTNHFYSNVNLRPGSSLIFQDMTATGGGANRWGDTVPINLDGAAVVADATNNAVNNTETVGAITFDRGSRIQLITEGTGDAFLTAASVTRASASAGAGSGRGTLVFAPSATATFGAAATAPAAETQFRSTAVITPSATSAVTGMLPGYYMESNGNRFVKNGANGVTPVVDGDMVAMPTGAGAGNEVVNITAATTMGSFETSIFALRGGAFTLNSPTGASNDATITLTGSGADVGGVASFGAFVINPNLKFGSSGTNEALFYTGSTLTVNGNITAGSITKFGVGGTLVIANDQSDAVRGTGNGYQGGWVVNEGTLQLNQFGSAGNAHASNTIVLNGAQAGSAQLNLRAQPADTLLNYTYSSGKIIAVDNATIDWDPAADDRVHTIADVEIQQSGGIGLAPANGTVDAQLRIASNRARSILAAGSLTVTNNAILNVDTTATGSPFVAYSGNSAYLTNGLSSGFSVASLVGSQRLTKWGDATLYVRGDSSATFSGPVVIDQGALHVTHNGSLGTGAVTVNRYGVLDIGVANFQATNSSTTYNEGSIERWSVNNARTGTLNLGKGTLQIAANQPTTNVSVTLDGGGIEAFLRNDDNNAAQAGGGVMRILNPNVSFSLNSTSFIGTQYYLGANGLDSGRQIMDNQSLSEYTASGAILEVQGVIGGAGGLTKVGYDTVILSGNNTYSGATRIEGGRLLLGADNALPVTTNVVTTADGVLDLNGQNQTIGSLTNAVATTAVNSTSGFITNGGTSSRTLSVGNGITANFAYAGVIQHNVSLTKVGTATMTLNNESTYIGDTTVNGGILQIAGRLSGTREVVLNSGGTLRLNSASNNIVNTSVATPTATLTNVTFDGGSLTIDNSRNSNTQTFNELSVLSDSSLDFGTGNTNVFRFNSLAPMMGVLNVRGWTGTPYVAGTTTDSGAATQDRLRFTTSPGTPGTALNGMVFFNDAGVSVGRGLVVNDSGLFGVVASNMATAYWKGGLASKAWNLGNWSTDLAGTTVPGLAPTGATDVIISATGQVGQDIMLLGENMQVKSVTVNSENPGTPVEVLATGGHTLTVLDAAAITSNSGAPAATFNTPVAFSASTATVAVNSTSPLALVGAVSGNNITKTGTGTLILAGANTHTGTTTISAGVLRAGSNGALGTTAGGTTVAAGATLELSGNVTITGEGLTLNGNGVGSNGALRNVSGDNLFAGPITLATNSRIQSDIAGDVLSLDVASGPAISGVDTNVTFSGDGDITVADAISLGTGGLTKEGAGVLILGGTNTYTGTTTVSNGVLAINGNNSAATGDVTVGANGILGGNGTVGGNTQIFGSVSTGANPDIFQVGTLNFNGKDVTFNDNSSWFVDLVRDTNNMGDQIGNAGLFSIGSNVSLNLVSDLSTFVYGNTYTIATYSSFAGGAFSGLAQGDVLSGYQINYGANAITLTAVPEPGTLGLLGLALGGFFFRRIRRRRAEVVMVDSEKSES